MADVTGDANPDLTINAPLQINQVSAGSNLVMTGPGTLLLTATNTYTGTTTISGGTLQIGNNDATGTLGTGDVTDNGALIFSRSDSGYSYGGVISGSGSVTTAGSGTVRLTGANTYTGPTIIGGGTLILGGAAGSGALATSGISVAAGAGLAFTPGSTSTITLPAGATFSLDGGTVAFDLAGGGASDQIAVDTFTLSADSSFTFATAGGVSFGSTYTLVTYNTLDNAGPFTIAGMASGRLNLNPVIGANAITLTPVLDQGVWASNSGGNWSAGPWNNYTPSVAGDAALFGAAPGLTADGTIVVDMPETVGYITFDNSVASYTIGTAGSNNLTLDNGADSALITVIHGSHTIAENIALNSPLAISTDASTTLTISGAINGNQSLSKHGDGTLNLSGPNTYSGGTTIDGGLLVVGSGGTLGAAGSAVAVDAGGTLDLGGGTVLVGAVTIAGGTIQNGTLTATSFASTGGAVQRGFGRHCRQSDP